MVVPPRAQRLILPVAPLVAGALGLLVAIVFALLSDDLLGQIVLDSGIPSIIEAANPPLHATARIVLILGCGGSVALVAWFALFLLLGSRSIVVQRGGAGTVGEEAPVLRRADAHPDAPARRPVLANRDLGTPFLDVRAPRAANDAVPVAVHIDADIVAPSREPIFVERDLPADLDQPLAAYDPAALPDQPLDWFPPPVQLAPAPRRQVFEPTERFETFSLNPPPPPAPAIDRAAPPPPPWITPPVPRADPSTTIHALLDRLERGVARRESVAPPPAPEPAHESIEDTLTTLRRLATQAR